jgi:hypothetical protein
MHTVVGVIPQARRETVFIASGRYRICDSSKYYTQHTDASNINFYVTA